MMASEDLVKLPTEEEQAADSKLKALADLTKAMSEAALARTREFSDLWVDGFNYVFNNQLAEKKRALGHIPVQVNMIWPAIKAEQALLAQRRPKIETEPVEAEDARASDFWTGLLRYLYDKTLKMPQRAREATLDGKLTGWYVAKIEWNDRAHWDEKRRRWTGQPEVSVIDSRRFGMDPNAERLEDAQYAVYEGEYPAEEAIARWPKYAEAIRKAMIEGGQPSVQQSVVIPPGQRDADTETDADVLSSRAEGKLVSILARAGDRVTVPSPESEGRRDAKAQKVRITEVYFRDAAEKTEKVIEDYPGEELLTAGVIKEEDMGVNPDTGEPRLEMVALDPASEYFRNVKRPYKKGEPLSLDDWPTKDAEPVKVPKFPRGRVVFKVNDIILNPKEEDQVWRRKRWPFEIGVNHLLPHLPQGLNAVEMCRALQDWVNVSATKILDWLFYFADAADVFAPGALKEGEAEDGRGKLRKWAGRIIQLVKGTPDSAYKRVAAPPLPAGLLDILQTMKNNLQDLAGVHNPDLGAQSRGGATATEIATLQQSTATSVGLQMMFLDEWIVRCMEQVAELVAQEMEVGEMARIVGQRRATEAVEFTEDLRDFEFDVKLNVGTALPWDKERRRKELVELKTLYPDNPEIDRMVLEMFDVDDPEAVLQAGQLYAGYLQYLEQVQQEQELEAQGAAQEAPAIGAGA